MDGGEFTAEQPVFSTLRICGDRVTAVEKCLRCADIPVLTPAQLPLLPGSAGSPGNLLTGACFHSGSHVAEVSPSCPPEGRQEQAHWNYYSF